MGYTGAGTLSADIQERRTAGGLNGDACTLTHQLRFQLLLFASAQEVRELCYRISKHATVSQMLIRCNTVIQSTWFETSLVSAIIMARAIIMCICSYIKTTGFQHCLSRLQDADGSEGP